MRSEPRKRPALRLVGTGTAPAIRWTKVRTARARLAAGYYDRETVREQVLDAVLSEFRKR